MRFASAALCLCMAWGTAFAQEGPSGRDIFDKGSGISARVMDTDVPGARFACRRCHGMDGRGEREGATVMPPIDWAALSVGRDARPAYTPESFHQALTDGISASGRQLDAAMPRYAVERAQSDALLAYLQELPAIEARGVESDAVHIGIVSTPRSRAVASAYRRHLQRALAAHSPDNRIFGRSIRVRSIEIRDKEDLPEALVRNPVVAIVGLAPMDAGLTDDILAEGSPVLFPLFPLTGMEDRDLAHGLMPDRNTIFEALADRIKAEGHSVTVVIGDAPAEATAALERKGVPYRRAGDNAGTANEATAFLVFPADNDNQWIGVLPRHGVVYGIAGQLQHAVPLLQKAGIRYRLAVEGTSVVEIAALTGVSALVAHAGVTAELLQDLQRTAGRELRRTTMMAGFRKLRRELVPGVMLNYARSASGTSKVKFISNP